MHIEPQQVEVWRVEGNDLVEVNSASFGHFYAGDSYVILYTYRPRRKEEYIIYTWQGLDSSKDEVRLNCLQRLKMIKIKSNFCGFSKAYESRF